MRRLCAALGLVFTMSACSGDPVEVTRVVQQTVEITRIVESTVVVERVVTQTPRPTPKATATPEAPEGGTKQAPYKVGEEAALVQGGKLEFKLTILEVLRGEEAYRFAKQANQFNDPPLPGFEFVITRIGVKYDGKDQGILKLDRYGFSVLSKGQLIRYFDMNKLPCCIEPEFKFELFQGGEGEGWAPLVVHMDEENPLLVLGGADGLYFSLTPSTS